MDDKESCLCHEHLPVNYYIKWEDESSLFQYDTLYETPGTLSVLLFKDTRRPGLLSRLRSSVDVFRDWPPRSGEYFVDSAFTFSGRGWCFFDDRIENLSYLGQ